ncbi:MAG: uroporphyrinogen-III C-methyltransferase [Alphaproteobacteria bacterium]|nr:uroporphyrinogen-III C-methyltransferase [Alphaproteobacteria bacterium]
MRHLPFFFDVRDRKVAVLGEGPAAEQRAALARSAGAVALRLSAVGPDNLKGIAALFVATGDAGCDRAAQRLARSVGVPVNVIDRPELCDFIVPAIVDRDDVVVAISTGGDSPTLAASLRRRIEHVLPQRIGALACLVATFRAQAKALIVEPERRRAFWRRLVEGPVAELALAGEEAGARRAALGELDAARRQLAPTGIAHIVGAGPGDPDLLTLRALRLLGEADAILHDDLVPSAVLARARRDAELVAVGKRKGQPGWPQEAINAELVRRVRAGQIVVRLKAGDPFVFGRGGEEVEALQQEGLAVTVVPGITAALGCAAAVGVPLTHRKLASAVTFVTGHGAADGKEAAWPLLAAQGHTLAIYMGATEAASVRDRLLGAGTAPTTPVAIVENGTRPDQRVSTGRLADLARLAVGHTRGDAGPSLIIVGEVAAHAAAEQPPLAKVS